MATHLRTEKQALIQKDHRLGQQVIETKEWVDRYGWRKAAALSSVARICRLLSLAASTAPEHQRVLEMLLAIKAVEFMENGTPVARSYQRQLRWCYSQLSGQLHPTEGRVLGAHCIGCAVQSGTLATRTWPI